MPKKYQPDLPYLRKVLLKRVHLFTAIQFLCLAFLCAIKEVKLLNQYNSQIKKNLRKKSQKFRVLNLQLITDKAQLQSLR